MGTQQANIIAALQKDILLMQGFRPVQGSAGDDAVLSLIGNAFPNNAFPVAGLHEFIYSSLEEASVSTGFICSLLSGLTKYKGTAVFISPISTVFPAGLPFYGIAPEQILFITLRKEKDRLWAMEEALRCDAFSAVVTDIREISFTESRRFQLAIEQTGVAGFLLRQQPRNLATASVTRWRVRPLHTDAGTKLPGVGIPRWKVELQKVRNGKPGKWMMEWDGVNLKKLALKAEAINEMLRKVV